MPMPRRMTAAACLLALAAGCVAHEARPAFRRGILVDDRGISVPLPPPSLADEPYQEVDVEGTVPGDDTLSAGTKLHVEDLDGDAGTSVEVNPTTESFKLQGVWIDLTANCLELWLEAPDGRESERTHVRAVIVSDTEIRTEPGCD